ncbi:hypothetical protein FDP41_013627 [Naegleria fowleri]|uniref:Uncharacterized protein n=1 Tax=Naegleria fowleri TaxID=5763 RepID=A0A6A5BQS6_NAEFO|nr:uncharacterized protein FDP41_013627 [Naegleria fowleri]KAF0980413.1 hypothetical protein FDP41_013627 [Naegleria fowleri]
MKVHYTFFPPNDQDSLIVAKAFQEMLVKEGVESSSFREIVLEKLEIPQLHKVLYVDANPNHIRIVDEDGKMFVIENHAIHPENDDHQIILQRMKGSKFVGKHVLKTYPIFDGVKFKVIGLASYTEHALFIVKDTNRNQTVLYGIGSNLYRQLCDKHELSKLGGQEGKHVKFPVMIFDPSKEIKDSTYGSTDSRYTITHVGCAFSFSVCVINNIHVHMSGQNWLKEGSEHNWSDHLITTDCPVKQVACGNFHVCILTQDNRVWTGGSCYDGQCIKEHALIGCNPLAFCSTHAYAGSDNLLLKSAFGFYHIYGSNDFFPRTHHLTVNEIERKYGLPVSDEDDAIVKPIINPFKLEIEDLELNRNYLCYRFKNSSIVLFKGSAYDSTGSINDLCIDLEKEFSKRPFCYRTGPNSFIAYEASISVSITYFFTRMLEATQNVQLSDVTFQ